MQLEIGKYYATRLGTIAKIVGNGDMAMYAGSDRAGLYEFEGEMADTMTPRQWRGDGVFDDASQNCALDLIREATPDEVIAFEAGWDSVFPTADDVVDAEFPEVSRENLRAEIEGMRPPPPADPDAWKHGDPRGYAAPNSERTYADLFDNTTATSRAEPWEGSEAQAREIEGMEIDRAIGRSVAFRNRASGIMQAMLGIAAILFALADYFQ